jgi:hypothetical protein
LSLTKVTYPFLALSHSSHHSQELIKLHGGILEVESTAEEESTNGRNGSVCTVILNLGRGHLPRSMVDEKPGELPMNSKYARGMVEEVNHWGATTGGEDVATPSESSDSGGSSEGSRLDPSVLFFSKSDLIMIGIPFLYSIYKYLLTRRRQLMITPRCAE